MKSKTLYLHIGMGKTGTTAIQQFCMLNNRLLKRRGYLFPGLGLHGESHHLLGHAWGVGWMPEQMIEELVPPDIWEQVYALFQKSNQHMIISAEILTAVFARKPESMRDIRQLFEDHPVKIIFYVRRQDQHAQSVYNQRVKTGLTSEKFDSGRLPKFYDFHKFLVSASEVFGKDSIIVRPYEKDQFRDGNIFSDFIGCLGLDWDQGFKIPKKNYNPRLDGRTLEFVRMANGVERPWESKMRFNQSVLQALTKDPDQQVFSQCATIPAQMRIDILKRFEQSNRKVAVEFLGRPDGMLFLEPGPGIRDECCWEEQRFAAADVVKISVELWEKIHVADQENFCARLTRWIARRFGE